MFMFIPELSYLPSNGNGTTSNIMAQSKDHKDSWVTLLRRRVPNSRRSYWYEVVYTDSKHRVVVESFEGSEAGVEDARDSFYLYTEEIMKIEELNNNK